MKKGLKNLLLSGAVALGLAGGVKSNAQEIVVNPFVATNANDSIYNTLETKAQRDSLVQAERNADWCDVASVPYKLDVFDCTEFTKQAIVNNNDFGDKVNLYEGYSGEPTVDALYTHKGTLRDMGKRGLPYFSVYINSAGGAHEQLAILTGDSLGGDPRVWENWDFVEPQRDAVNVQPGDYFMPENCEVVVNYNYVKENEVQEKYLRQVSLVKFQIRNENSESVWMNDDPNVKIYTNRLSATDQEFEELNIENPVKDSTYKDDVFFKYELKDENLDLENSYYKINGVKNYFSDSKGEVALDSKQGLNKLEVFALDKAGNSREDKRNFYYEVPDTNKTVTETASADNLENILVYPTRVSSGGVLNLDYQNPKGKETYLEIYNTAGQLIGKENSNSDKIIYDSSDLSSGVYIYRLRDSEKVLGTGKFIRE